MECVSRLDIQVPIHEHACLLKKCKSKQEGKLVYANIIKKGLAANIILRTTLLEMYGRYRSLVDAQRVFDSTYEHDVFSWMAIISAYTNNNQEEKALDLFNQMQRTAVEPDKFIFAMILKACARVLSLNRGRQIHCLIIRSGIEIDVFIRSTLVDMYANCGSIVDAEQVFSEMPRQDSTVWTALIAGYVQQGFDEKALILFNEMQAAGVLPEEATLVSVLRACANLGILGRTSQVHLLVIENGYESMVSVGTALVDAYASCGNPMKAQQISNKMPYRNVVSWSAVIAGYAKQGLGKEVIISLEKMQEEGVMPNDITFISILSACSHLGLVEEGHRFFESMERDYGVPPTVDHYACMIDLLGRLGHLEEAEKVVNSMSIPPDELIWMTLLGACRNWGNTEIGQRAANQVIKLNPRNKSVYVLTSNIYAASNWGIKH